MIQEPLRLHPLSQRTRRVVGERPCAAGGFERIDLKRCVLSVVDTRTSPADHPSRTAAPIAVRQRIYETLILDTASGREIQALRTAYAAVSETSAIETRPPAVRAPGVESLARTRCAVAIGSGRSPSGAETVADSFSVDGNGAVRPHCDPYATVSAMDISTRAATTEDAEAIEVLLPRLAAFDPLPPGRKRDDLWRPDLVGLQAWARGDAPDTSVRVAMNGDDIVGAGIVTYGPDPFTGQLNAHLLAIVVAPSVDGHGVGQRLMAELDNEARRRGAETMSLNVFTTNERARALYARLGFHEELIRAVRPLR